jgi:hypothetical protein
MKDQLQIGATMIAAKVTMLLLLMGTAWIASR